MKTDRGAGLRRLGAPLWALSALAIMLAFNAWFADGFFSIGVRDGRLTGELIDILRDASQLAIVASGMALVIATGGVDLSVGVAAAIASATLAVLVPQIGFAGACAAALACGLFVGGFNALLVAGLGLQPIVATLVAMVAGRGIAQFITGGITVATHDPGVAFLAGGGLLGLPFPIALAVLVVGLVAVTTRATTLGLMMEGVGSNRSAARYCGLPTGLILGVAYTVCGLCAAVAGLIECSYIRAADPSSAGMYMELDAILAVVIGGGLLTGGRFSLSGAVLGALVIETLTRTLYRYDVSSDVAPLPKAAVIIGVCLVHSDVARARARQAASRLFGRGSGA